MNVDQAISFCQLPATRLHVWLQEVVLVCGQRLPAKVQRSQVTCDAARLYLSQSVCLCSKSPCYWDSLGPADTVYYSVLRGYFSME